MKLRIGRVILLGCVGLWLRTTFGAGATSDERSRVLPGDSFISDATMQLTHAISIAVPPAEIWPWIVQMGYRRGGWYTPAWVDRVWGVHNPSADVVVESLQCVAVGDIIPDGPPGTAHFVVLDVAAPHTLLLHSVRHPVTGRWPDEAAREPHIDFTWVFAVEASGTGDSRLLIRTRGRAEPRWLSAVGRALFPPIDCYMARAMLNGIKARAEGDGVRRT